MESTDQITLPCDTSQSFNNDFAWNYSEEKESGYNPVFRPPDSSSQGYKMIGEGSSAALSLENNDETRSGLYCCELFYGSLYNTYVSKVYDVVIIKDNLKPTLEASTGDNLVDSGTKIELHCSELALGTQVGSPIVPTIQLYVRL